MQMRRFGLFLCLGAAFAFAHPAISAVVFKAGEKAKYVPPGEEEMNGNAEQLFHIAQVAEQEHNPKRAMKAYKALVRKHPRDALAPGALYRAAELIEQSNDLLGAAIVFRNLVERYPSSPHFEDAIEAQFRIGEVYLAGKKLKVLGIPFATSMDRAVEIFAAIIRTAPYGKYTARAQFDIGLAREKQHLNDAALEAYQAVVDKFPTDPLAPEAQYQIGYLWFTTSKAGTRDIAATKNARVAFQDFLFRYPTSEKAAQAKANLRVLEHKQTSTAYDVARFYDRQKHYRSAVIYYNEVIREQPGSPESERAQKRIDELKAKLGSSVTDLVSDINKSKTKPGEKQKPAGPSTSNSTSTSTQPSPLLPPPETDSSLPPPSSLAPDTSIPSSSSTEDHSTSAASPTPDVSAAPEATASPAP
jgi:outer membrane protein assembly factor BamD